MKTSKKSTGKLTKKREKILNAAFKIPSLLLIGWAPVAPEPEPGFLFFFPKPEFPPIPADRVRQGLLFEEAGDA
jgi:hypothetical protein